MSILDTTIVNVAIETLGRDLDASLSSIQWVSTGYLLALATVIPLTGWAMERFGGRRVWMVSVALFLVGLHVVRARVEHRVADLLPRDPGVRRRDDPAGRAGDPGPGRGAAADGAGDERDRRADAARPDPRAGDRRADRRQLLVALDLLREHPGGRGGAGAGRPDAAARGGSPAPSPCSTSRAWRCCRRGSCCWSTGCPSTGRTGASRGRCSLGLGAGVLLIAVFVWHAVARGGARADRPAAVPRPGVRGGGRDDVHLRRVAVRRDADPAALLPGGAGGERAVGRPAAGAAGGGRGDGDAGRRAADGQARRGADRAVRRRRGACSAPASTPS